MALIGRLDREQRGPLTQALDACNIRWCRDAVVPARAGLATKRAWNTNFVMCTPQYIAQVPDLPAACASTARIVGLSLASSDVRVSTTG
ncbi:DUF4113 domain-containing protein [Methylobacterium tardum]|uniref:DUF4113 domain-containing protein n=1 Tax=Methylobacterium tardum TaxID=374432 RepID=UPI001EE0B05A|nr:DUF4113 domain-containing protein [Methylobacterium tardum]URD39535.1 DUF4113 domain-containing protein [Methylobacterium tardum]